MPLLWDAGTNSMVIKASELVTVYLKLNARLVRKIIQIVCAEMLNIDRGVLALGLDCWKRPVGYFSCQLDNVSKGQPSCLRAMTATVFLMQEDRKLALEQKKMTALVMCMVTVTVE